MPSTLFCVSTVALVFALAEAWPSAYDNEFKRWSLSRRSFCQDNGGNCYSTGDCCKNYVCAAYDENASGDLNPTSPGVCVHEKDLQPCVTSLDCDNGKCVNLEGHRYCVKTSSSRYNNFDEIISSGKFGGGKYGTKNVAKSYKAAKAGKKGQPCESDLDCDRASKLCCQRLVLGRTKRQQCEPILSISKCIRKRK